MNRRQFVTRNGLVCAGALTVGGSIVRVGHAATWQDTDDTKKKDAAPKKKRPPRLDLDLVKEMVGVSHSKLDRVKELVEQEPRLVNACHDWTAGDFETALGAAAHTGQREIALFLLEKGARIDIFAAAMLGRIDIVKATLTAYPEMIHTKGPHGIPLIRHAKAGKEHAAEVLDYLETLTA